MSAALGQSASAAIIAPMLILSLALIVKHLAAIENFGSVEVAKRRFYRLHPM